MKDSQFSVIIPLGVMPEQTTKKPTIPPPKNGIGKMVIKFPYHKPQFFR